MKMIVCLLGIILSFGVFGQSDLNEVQMRFENSEFACLDVIDGQQYLLRFNNYNKNLYLSDSNDKQIFIGLAHIQTESIDLSNLSIKLAFTSTQTGDQILGEVNYLLSSQEVSASFFLKGNELLFKNCRLFVHLKSSIFDGAAWKGINVSEKFTEILAKDVGVLTRADVLNLSFYINKYHVKFKDPQPFLTAVYKRMVQVLYDPDLIESYFEEIRKALM